MKVIKTVEDDQGRHWKLVQEGEYIYLKNHFTYCVGRGKEFFSKVLDMACECWDIRYEDISLDECFDTKNHSIADNIVALTMGDGANIRCDGGWVISVGKSKNNTYIIASNEYETGFHKIGYSGNGVVAFYPEAKIVDICPGVFIKGKEIK